MNLPAAIVVLVLLLLGPLAVHFIERNIEAYILALGVAATLIGSGFDRELVAEALGEPVKLTLAVIGAGLVFTYAREPLDRAFERLRRRIPRVWLAGLTVFILAALSSVITAIIAALVLVEVIGLLRLAGEERIRVTVAACFAIGLGAALTPLGEPLSTLASSALELPFLGLFHLLVLWVLPGMAAASVLAAFFARGSYGDGPAVARLRESPLAALIQGLRVYVFVVGLVLVSNAYAPLAARFVPLLSDAVLYWVNTLSAVLDNATLVALEVHRMAPERARDAIIALLLSGGMLIPGNIPNIVSAGALRIGSMAWARIGLPIGAIMLGIYFAVLMVAG
jgi:predicted cation transporter